MDEKLVVVWSSGDREVALKMVFMYTRNARKRGWFDDVTFVIWGPSAQLLAADAEIQAGVAEMKNEGVRLEACRACADGYGVSADLDSLGVDVRYMGEPLTGYLKEGRRVLTF